MIHLVSASAGQPTLRLGLWGAALFYITAAARASPCTVSVHSAILLRLLESSLGVAVDGAGRVMCPVVTSSDTCFLLLHERHSPNAVFAREGTHRGPVQCLSAAPPQVLLLLKGSQAYHGAWRLRLVEGWLLFFSFPSAARGYWLPPLSFSRLHTLCVCGHSCSVLRASLLIHLLRVDGMLLF